MDDNKILRAAFGFFHDESYLDAGETSAQYINMLDNIGFQVFVYGQISDRNFLPHMLLDIISETVGGQLENTCYVFLSDIPELCELVYKIYNNMFIAFVIFDRGSAIYQPIEMIYKRIYEYSDCRKSFDKPIFTDISINNHLIISGCDSQLNDLCEIIKYIEAYDVKCAPKNCIKRLFLLNTKYYLFDPSDGEFDCINLGNTNSKSIVRDNKMSFSIWNTEFICPIDLNRVIALTEYAKQIELDPSIYFTQWKLLNETIKVLITVINNSNNIHRNGYVSYLELLAHSHCKYSKVFVLSVLIYISHNKSKKTSYINIVYLFLMNNKDFTREEKYYLFHQLERIQFADTNVGNEETWRLSHLFYREVYFEYLERFKNNLTYIPKDNRDKGVLIFMSSQIMGFRHGTTKSVFEKAYSINNYLDKKITIINTKELMTCLGRLPFYNATTAFVTPEYEKLETINYNNTVFPFHQMQGLMPNDAAIQWLIDYVKQKKPYFILSFGGGSIVADILSNIVPTVCRTLVSRGMAITEGQFQVFVRKITSKDIQLINDLGKPKNHIIMSYSTYIFKSSFNSLTRVNTGLPSDKFLVVIVGNRLDDEITSEFIEAMLNTIHTNTHIVIIGRFTKFQNYCSVYPKLSVVSTMLGYRDDLGAVYELCDLYVNPWRNGGGISAAEALDKGLPIVTFNYGDVPLLIDSEYCVNSYQEMSNSIIHYATDKDYYFKMSEKAKKIAKHLANIDKCMQDLLNSIEQNPMFI